MINNPNKITLPDQNNKQDVVFETHWIKDASKVVRVTIGDNTAVLKIDDLYGLVFMLADPEQQMNLMPVRHTEVRKYIKKHNVMVKKPMKKGDIISVHCEVDVPLQVVEGLAGLLKERKNQFV